MASKKSVDPVKTLFVGPCPRCSGRHIALPFTRLRSAIRGNDGQVEYTHWSSCPETGEPVFIKQLMNLSLGGEFVFSEPTPMQPGLCTVCKEKPRWGESVLCASCGNEGG